MGGSARRVGLGFAVVVAAALMVDSPAALTEDWTPIWTQAGGDAEHSGVVQHVLHPLDVLEVFPMIFNASSERPEYLASSYSMAGVETPQGLYTLASAIEVPSCALVLLESPYDGSLQRHDRSCEQSAEGPGKVGGWSEGTAILGYDHIRGRIIEGYIDGPQYRILAATDASTGAVVWERSASDLGVGVESGMGGGTTIALPSAHAAGSWYTDSAIMDHERGLVVLALAMRNGENLIVAVDLDDGSPVWDVHVTAATLGDVSAPLDGPSSGIEMFSGVRTETGYVFTGWRHGTQSVVLLWTSFDGDVLGTYSGSSPYDQMGASGAANDDPQGETLGQISSWLTSDGRLAAELVRGDVVIVDPTSANPLVWDAGVEVGGSYTVAGPAWWADHLIVPSAFAVHDFDSATGLERWTWKEAGPWAVSSVLIVPPGHLYVTAAHNSTSGDEAALFLLDLAADEPRVLQRLTLPVSGVQAPGFVPSRLPDVNTKGTPPVHDGRMIPLSDGRLFVVERGGFAALLGTSDPQLRPRISVSNEYPAPGGTVELDIQPSAQPFEALTVAWGDGTVETVRVDSRLLHAYTEASDYEILVTGVMDGERTATSAAIVHVGMARPSQLTPLQRAFSPENQERTFFILGLLFTSVLAVVGAWRLRQRRSRLKAELALIDRVYESAGTNELRQETALAERRSHVRGLLADARIDAGEASVLERRIDELSSGLRLGTITQDLGFLSISMVQTLRAMLADGRVQEWEREHFFRALDQDRLLTAEQKHKVRKQIEQWFAADESKRA